MASIVKRKNKYSVVYTYQDEKGEWHSTCGMMPHPFLRPALEENREAILKILKEGITND